MKAFRACGQFVAHFHWKQFALTVIFIVLRESILRSRWTSCVFLAKEFHARGKIVARSQWKRSALPALLRLRGEGILRLRRTHCALLVKEFRARGELVARSQWKRSALTVLFTHSWWWHSALAVNSLCALSERVPCSGCCAYLLQESLLLVVLRLVLCMYDVTKTSVNLI